MSVGSKGAAAKLSQLHREQVMTKPVHSTAYSLYTLWLRNHFRSGGTQNLEHGL